MGKYNTNINVDIEHVGYQESNNLSVPKGANPGKINEGKATTSLINKLHLIKIEDTEFDDSKLKNDKRLQEATNFSDVCKMNFGAQQYDVDDFLYCKNLGFPINRMITLRRFPFPCVDNIYDTEIQQEPDVARMITYYDQNINKLEELMAFSYSMRWKELSAEMEQASMQGDQSGFENGMKKMMEIMDPNLAQNNLRGKNKLDYDPKHDTNKVYGPVDSLTTTNIRDVGLEFQKEFDIVFEYEMRSIGGRTPEYAFKDIIANVLACTYNNGKFWPGSRYWVGERPSQFYDKMKWMNPDNLDEFLFGGHESLKSALKQFGSAGSAIDTLKKALSGGFAMAMGKLLDKVGRPGILVMNSLLSGEATGYWHVSIGNPEKPMMVIGNLICTGCDVSFPTDELSYGDFPNKLMVKVKLKPAQSKDRAGIEMMFNMGKKRIYYNPKEVTVASNKNVLSKSARSFFGFETKAIDKMLEESYDFMADNIKSVSKTVISGDKKAPIENNQNSEEPTSTNNNVAYTNADKEIVDALG